MPQKWVYQFRQLAGVQPARAVENGCVALPGSDRLMSYGTVSLCSSVRLFMSMIAVVLFCPQLAHFSQPALENLRAGQAQQRLSPLAIYDKR